MYEIQRSDIYFFSTDLKLASLFFCFSLLFYIENLHLGFLVRDLNAIICPRIIRQSSYLLYWVRRLSLTLRLKSSEQELMQQRQRRQCNACVIYASLVEIKGSSLQVLKHIDHVLWYLFPSLQYTHSIMLYSVRNQQNDPFAIISNLTGALWLTY